MKLLKWTDKSGFKWQCWVKDNDVVPDYGIPHNPPDLSYLSLSQKQHKQLHNELLEYGLITHYDVLRSGSGVTNILRRMGLKHLRQSVIMAYKLKDKE